VVVDAIVHDLSAVPAHTTQYCRPRRPGSFVMAPGRMRRWELKLMPGESPDALREPEALRRALAEFVDPGAVEIWRSAVYRFHALVADRWRAGRVFLLGDAAHQMPPFLGQGLCAGVRDAANLAWKLPRVLRGDAPERLLDSYEAERRPHVARVVGLAKARGLIIGELDPAAAEARDARLRAEALGRPPRLRHQYIPGLEAGLIDLDGEGRPRAPAGEPFVQPRVRDRAGREGLLDDLAGPGFLLACGSASAAAWLDAEGRAALARIGARPIVLGPAGDDEAAPPGWLSLEDLDGVFAHWSGAAGVGAALVRPDRYVFGAAADAAGLSRLIVACAAQLG
jgi:3-(3-hydroxy-phenyl)propionate hydroxylase